MFELFQDLHFDFGRVFLPRCHAAALRHESADAALRSI